MTAVSAQNDSPYRRKGRDGWYGRYRDATKKRRRVKLAGQKKIEAEVELRELQDQANLIRRGVVTPEYFQVADGGLGKIGDLLAEFCAELEGARRSAGYVREFKTWVGGYARAAKIKTVNQAGTASIERWLSGMLKKGGATETRNKAATRLSTFFSWSVERKHLTENPAKGIKRVAGDGGKDPPRALTPDELESLLNTTTNAYRRMSYLLGSRAGLRVWESHRLEWGHMDLEGGWVVLPKQLTKMKRVAEIPMHRWILEAAKDLPRRGIYVCGPKTPSRYTWLRDLERAGIIQTKKGVKSGNWDESQLIGYRDDRGFVLSRRCLRKTCSAHMQALGASQIQVMQFMRHRSADMTNELYTDSRLLGMRGLVDQMDQGSEKPGVGVGSVRQRTNTENDGKQGKDGNPKKACKA